MRLAAKIFLASLIPLLILIEVASWSLGSLNRLVQTNRRIVSETLPALRHQAVASESMASIGRLHGRWIVLRDGSYEKLWMSRANALGESLTALSGWLRSPDERHALAKSERAFTRYRAFASDGARLRRLLPNEVRQVRLAGDRVARALHRLGIAIDGDARRAQAVAGTLETETWRAVLLALPLSGVLALLLSFAIALRVTRVLRRLATASSQLAQGSLKEPVVVHRSDEIGQLAGAFNTMAARLGELDRMKEQVYSHLSHELRTPLTSIREATHLLADRVAGPLEPRQARLVTIISDSTERLLRLVNRILDVSRLRAGLQPIDRRPVRLAAVTARALRELRPQADAAGVVLDDTGNGADPEVVGDEERLVEVVMNLVSNAIKASQAGATVRVGLEADGSRAALVVADDGVGIPREVLAQIFDPYVQAPGAPAGTGLGLAIVKSIVEAHGGDVDVDSEVGRGSRFTVRLRTLDGASRESTRDGAGRRRRSEHGRAALIALLVPLLALLSACSPGWTTRSPFAKPSPSAASALADADRSALAGRPREATAKYEAIVRDNPNDPAAAEAMHRLAMLRLEPGSPVRDRRAAAALLRRLESEHPETLAGREAKAWRGLLRQIDRCEIEATRRGADADKLRQTLESIKDSDLELEQHQ